MNLEICGILYNMSFGLQQQQQQQQLHITYIHGQGRELTLLSTFI